MEQKPTVKEHFVPRFYLKHFANEKGLLSVYDSETNQFFTAPPKRLFYEDNLYEIEFDGVNKQQGQFIAQNDIEKTFKKEETKYSKLLRIIEDRCSVTQNRDALILSSEEKVILYDFVVNMFVRNPNVMDRLQLNTLEKSIRDSEIFQCLDYSLKQMGFDGAEDVFKGARKKAMLTRDYYGSLPEKLANDLRESFFSFLVAHQGEFISSDFPISIGEDSSMEDYDKRTCLYLALTPKTAIAFGGYSSIEKRRNRMIFVEEDIVEKINAEMINKKHFTRFLFAHDEQVLRYAVEKNLCNEP